MNAGDIALWWAFAITVFVVIYTASFPVARKTRAAAERRRVRRSVAHLRALERERYRAGIERHTGSAK